MHLLSTVFRRIDGAITQMPHSLINTKALVNVRRSGPISENFEFHVDYKTSFEQIENLREKMCVPRLVRPLLIFDKGSRFLNWSAGTSRPLLMSLFKVGCLALLDLVFD
jgi:hypothetical protein